ncbi:putative U-box domain-containing protein 8-like [Iris pallida]|uniref:RING-type E3 ubiquitin transferase n=1 Tax=Iris pallida TaxID=29817 RepID=A0AAX6GAX0_IRIPA|nr:putative U-box domain-containing protein 8-like [Iris pallida]
MELSFPDDFRCPISLEVMSDPVILTSGHTFDRPSIQRWLDSGNLTCPVTNLPLPRHPSLIPNHALRRLISQFAPPHPTYLRSCHSPLSFPSDAETLTDLLCKIRSSSPDLRRSIADSQTPSVLFRHVSSRCGDHHHLRKLAAYCLLYLSLDDDDVKVGLVAEGIVDHLIAAVESKSDGSAAAATVITSLSTVDVNKCVIGAHPSAIPALAAMLIEERSSKREKKEAATAIYELAKFPENRRRVVRTGAVKELARMAGSGLDRAVEVLALLAKTKEGRAEMGRIEGFVRVLVRIVRSGSRRGAESAAAALELLSHEDGEIGAAAELVVNSGLAKVSS